MSRATRQKPRPTWPRPASARTLARFQKAAAEFDGAIVRAEWEPTFNHRRCFDGPEGGWMVKVAWPITWTFPSGQTHRDVAVGLSVDAVLQSIRWLGKDHKRLEARMAS